MKTHKIILTPHGHATAMRTQEGNHLGVSSAPLYAAARALLAAGLAHPDDKIETWWEGASVWSLRSSVGYAAAQTILEMAKGGIREVKYSAQPW